MRVYVGSLRRAGVNKRASAWCRTSRWCTFVHARRAYVAPKDATSASRAFRGSDEQRATAPEGSTVSGPQRQRTATNAWRDDRKPQLRAPLRQRAAWARRYVRVPKRQHGAKLVYAVVGDEQDCSCETTVPGTQLKI